MKHCFVDFGNSSLLGVGHHPYGDAWKISLENPYIRGSILNEISLRNQSISISGNTPKYTSHIVRPTTGEWVKTRKLISVISQDPLDVEVLSTVFMIADNREKEQIEQNFSIESIAEYII